MNYSGRRGRVRLCSPRKQHEWRQEISIMMSGKEAYYLVIEYLGWSSGSVTFYVLIVYLGRLSSLSWGMFWRGTYSRHTSVRISEKKKPNSNQLKEKKLKRWSVVLLSWKDGVFPFIVVWSRGSTVGFNIRFHMIAVRDTRLHLVRFRSCGKEITSFFQQTQPNIFVPH